MFKKLQAFKFLFIAVHYSCHRCFETAPPPHTCSYGKQEMAIPIAIMVI